MNYIYQKYKFIIIQNNAIKFFVFEKFNGLYLFKLIINSKYKRRTKILYKQKILYKG